MNTTDVSASIARLGNGLAVLANKCAAKTFDISSGMVYASMRDQIVRAQLLVRDLKQADPHCNRLLIVGAGLAGVCAAAHASALGIETVVLETNKKAFELQSRVSTRMVGPFMYEWPSIECQLQHYPPETTTLGEPILGTPNWNSTSPMPSSELATQLHNWLTTVMLTQKEPPQFRFQVPAAWTREYVTHFVAAASSGQPLPSLGCPPPTPSVPNPSHSAFVPDYVILAAGMGEERVHLVDGDPQGMRGLPFWRDDDLRASGIENIEVAVFGAGDGALQDVLRLVTKHDHPLALIEALESGSTSIRDEINQVRPLLASLEQQSRLFATWSRDTNVYDLIDKQCEQLCEDLAKNPKVQEKILSELRIGTGRVHHVYREQYLTRAYLLNRFCVHLINACQHSMPHSQNIKYVRYKETTVLSAVAASTPITAGGGGTIQLSGGLSIVPAKLVVRFGPDKQWIESSQIVRLTPKTHPDRISMSAIPLPYIVSA
ncbi:FAD-binding oxidoreductase [Acidovorax sp. Be4]|uniref:FAD-binding oxidoreductase n=1 Tax=Acidovorax bellezanensis TaxID=2976702 RepID=A0ABT2PLW0_9BURK|nr:FAD-dependent oxidoreductase [Acidovorax sp. Be4]MCT9810829.1 FAD-binding oxidoreductase [Acidovorax sp. Be4]